MTRSAAPSHMQVLHIYAAGDQCPEDNAGLQDHLQMPLVSLHAVYLVATFCHLTVAAFIASHLAWVAL